MAAPTHVEGVAALSKRLALLRRVLVDQLDVTPVLQLLLKKNRERYDQQVAPDGTPWKPLSSETVRTKRRRGGRRKILQDTGALRKGIKIIRGALSEGGFAVNTGAGARIGIDDPRVAEYGRLHQKGEGVPKRRFLGVNPSDALLVDSLLKRVIIRRAGLR